jgi:hypothetical protein
MLGVVKFCHDADPTLHLFVELDGLGAGELEDPVDRIGKVEPQFGCDMPLDMTVQWVAAG